MLMPRSSLFLFTVLVGLTATARASLPDKKILQAKTLEEFVEALSPSPKTLEQLLRGRRRLANGDVEDSAILVADQFSDSGKPGFYHSVASGDPLLRSVIVWTRYTPAHQDDVVPLEFRMATVQDGDDEASYDKLLNPQQNPKLFSTTVHVTKDTDFVAKLDVQKLKPGTKYVFAFQDGETSSDVGVTRTAPKKNQVESLTYAFFSCSHFTNGYFHAYDIASTIQDLDLWIHVGDYYYEYGLYDSYARDASETRDQFVLPVWETVTLNDYRNRHSTHVAYDEGLRNLRRRAPMIATWDDHETTNDSWANENEGAGAENHQETCPVTRFSADEEKRDAKCDRDEGIALDRFKNAVKAYLEWMPIRTVQAPINEIDSVTQVIEWGNLATIVSFDTRLSYRSSGPTGGSRFGDLGPFAFTFLDVDEYDDPTTSAGQALLGLEQQLLQERNDPSFEMAGDFIDNVMAPAFQNSVKNGKPWQIWAANTMMGPYVLPDIAKAPVFVPELQGFVDLLLSLPTEGLTPRILNALAVLGLEWNRDDYGGFGAEKARIIQLAKEGDWNMVALGGDLHDFFGWKLYEGGTSQPNGDAVAVNIGTGGVTSPGLGPLFNAVFAPVASAVGGVENLFPLYDALFLAENPTLVFSNVQYKGFVAVKATHESHVSEFFGIPPQAILSDYPEARASNQDGLTAEFFCMKSLVTYSGTPGSLEPQEGCSAISFVSSRSPLLDIPVPTGAVENTSSHQGCGDYQCEVDFKKSDEDEDEDEDED